MKIKFIWEVSDIECGMYFIKNSSPLGSADLSFASTVCFKLGFLHTDGEKSYVLISMMTDGMVYKKMETKEDVVNMLNEESFGYRPLTKDEYVAIISRTNQGFINKPLV